MYRDRCLYNVLIIALTVHNAYSAAPAPIDCPENQAMCIIDCQNHTINGQQTKNFTTCSNAVVDATNAVNLTVKCQFNNGTLGCSNLNVMCPSYDTTDPDNNFCRIDCSGNYACSNVKMDGINSNLVQINCSNDNPNKTMTVCESMDISSIQKNSINLDCHNKAICNAISIHTFYPSSIAISISNQSELSNSGIIDHAHWNNLSLYLNTNSLAKNNTFSFYAAESIIRVQFYAKSSLAQNNFKADGALNISITSDSTSLFDHNNIDGASIQNSINIKDVIISNSNIYTQYTPIFNLYDSKIDNSYIDVSHGHTLNIINSQITSNTKINADNVYLSHLFRSIIDNSTLDVHLNTYVNINDTSLHNQARIYATNVTNNIDVNVGVNATANGKSMIDAKYANNFSLICHGLCNDFAIYTPKMVNSQTKAFIKCVEYGCKSLDLYTYNNSNDITFIPSDCPCPEDITTACIDSWDIHCNYDEKVNKYLNHSEFTSATHCDGICCGDIINSMHEPGCLWPNNYTYDCLPGNDCFIDCNRVDNKNNVFNNFSCNTHRSIINATSSTSLTVLCHDDKGACNNLTVLCPTSSMNALCNITCDGKAGCNLLKVDTQSTSKFMLQCSIGECNDISINNNYNTNTTNIVSINCNNGNCTNMNVYNLGHSQMSIICDDQCRFNKLIMNGSEVSKLGIFGKNGIITDSILNVEQVGVVNIDIAQMIDTKINGDKVESFNITSSELFQNNIINSPNVSKISIDITCSALKNCLFDNNILYVNNAREFHLNTTTSNNTAQIINNAIIGNHVQTAIFYTSHFVDFVNNSLELMFAKNLNIQNYGSMRNITINAILSKQVLIKNYPKAVINDAVLFMDNATNIDIINNGFVDQMTINAKNSNNVSKQCMDYSSCNFILNAMYASDIYFSVNTGNSTNSVLNGVGTIINAQNAGNIFISIGDEAQIDDNNLVLNANNASLLNMTINGVLRNNDNLKTHNITSYIMNGNGIMENSVINCNLCKNLDVNLLNVRNNTINMNNGKILNIFGWYHESNLTLNTFYSLFAKTLSINIDDGTSFNENNLYLNNSENVIITNNGNFGKNIIYGNNIKNSFNLSCPSSTTHCGYKDLLFLDNAKSVNIYIGQYALNTNTLNISAQYAESINIDIDGVLTNSVINGKNAKYLSVKCSANEIKYGCHNVSIISSPLINNKTSSYLTCTKYGCQHLNLYTRKDADDINVTGKECPCDVDLVTLCIKKWEIHCKNDSDGVSVFQGYKNCTGKCCGSIDKRLEEKYCESSTKSKKTKYWIYILIGCIGLLLILIIIIYFIYKKRKKTPLLLNYD